MVLKRGHNYDLLENEKKKILDLSDKIPLSTALRKLWKGKTNTIDNYKIQKHFLQISTSDNQHTISMHNICVSLRIAKIKLCLPDSAKCRTVKI